MKPVTEYPFNEELLKSERFFWNCRTPEQLEAYHKKLKRRIAGDNDYTALLAITQNNRKLFSLISSITDTMDGWTSQAKASALAAIVLTMKPAVAIEIGVWAGKGILPIAFAMRENGGGIATGIDPYSAKASVDGEFGENAKWWSDQEMHDDIKKKFLTYVKKFGMETWINLIQKKSDDVTPPVEGCDLLSIDGNHCEQAIRDVERFAPSVNRGGIVFMDDRHWQGGAVLRAEDILEDMGFGRLFDVTGNGDDWSAFQRIK
jgi:predicted O-methyltransferase YrrM